MRILYFAFFIYRRSHTTVRHATILVPLSLVGKLALEAELLTARIALSISPLSTPRQQWAEASIRL